MIGAANRPESRIVPTLIGAVRWRGLGVPLGGVFGSMRAHPAGVANPGSARFGRLVVRIGVGDVFGQAPPEKSGNWPSSGAMENAHFTPESAGPGSPGPGLARRVRQGFVPFDGRCGGGVARRVVRAMREEIGPGRSAARGTATSRTHRPPPPASPGRRQPSPLAGGGRLPMPISAESRTGLEGDRSNRELVVG